jgi:probable F420-dependent oxidoreductase
LSRIGVELPATLPAPVAVELAVLAEQLGLDDVWVPELGEPDAFVLLAAAAMRTQRVRIGTAIVPLGVRSPAGLASAAVTLDALAPGRVALGVGVSTPVVVEQWHGGVYAPPLARARESFAVLRHIMAGHRTDFDGSDVRSRGFRLRRLPELPIPLGLAAVNRKMLRLAGEIADAVWMNLLPLAALPAALAEIDEGAGENGRPEICMGIPCLVTEDLAIARKAARSMLFPYLTAEAYQRALEWHGYGEEVARARAAWAQRDRGGVLDAVSDRLVDDLFVYGPAELCVKRLRAFLDAGVDTVMVALADGTPIESLTALVEAGLVVDSPTAGY